MSASEVWRVDAMHVGCGLVRVGWGAGLDAVETQTLRVHF
jgi:hypothetical protein